MAGGFVGGFADGLQSGLDRAERRKARKAQQGNQPDYGEIDAQYGTGVGPWIARQKYGASDWLHRNTGGIFGRQSTLPGAVNLGSPLASEASFEEGAAHGGMIRGNQRGYADGGGVVRSFDEGGSVDDYQNDPFDEYLERYAKGAQLGELIGEQREEQTSGSGEDPPTSLKMPPRSVSPAEPGSLPMPRRDPASDYRDRYSRNSDEYESTAPKTPAQRLEALRPQRSQTSTPVPEGALPLPPQLSATPPREAGPSISDIPSETLTTPSTETPPPDGAATSSPLGRFLNRNKAENEATIARQKEITELTMERRRLSGPFRQRTEAGQAEDAAEIAKIDARLAELEKAPPKAPAKAAPAASGKPTEKPTAVPVRSGASPRVPPKAAPATAPVSPAGAATAPIRVGIPGRQIGVGGGPAGLPPRPGAAGGPPPSAPPNTTPATTTTQSGTGGGTGASPAPTPPPTPTAPAGPGGGATAPANTTRPAGAPDPNKAYDPSTQGPGNIPVGTVVPGSGPGDKPSAVVLRPDAQGQQSKQVVSVDQLTPDENDLLHEAILGGTRHLRQQFDQESQTAVPGAPNPQRDAGRRALEQGYGAAGPAAVQKVDQALQQRGLKLDRMDKWQTARLVHGYQFYKMRGDTKKADAFAGELLQHHNIMLQKYGQGALEALKQGDPITAEKHILEGYNIHLLDGMTARKGPGNSVEFVNPKGAVVRRMAYTPQNLWAAATGMSNGSLFHRELEARYRNSAAYKAQLKEAREERNAEIREKREERADERERRAEERDRRRGAGGAAAPGPASNSILYGHAEGGMVQGQSYAEGGMVDPEAAVKAAIPEEAVPLTQMKVATSVEPYSASSNGGTAGAGVGGDASAGGAGGADGTSGVGSGSDAGDGPGADGGSYRRGGAVRHFQNGGGVEELPEDFFTDAPPVELAQAAAPPSVPPDAALASEAPLPELPPERAPQAVPLVPSVVRQRVDTDEQAEAVNRGRSELDPNPAYVPPKGWHEGAPVRETGPIPSYEKENPDDTKPVDPATKYAPGWQQRLNEIERRPDKASKASAAATRKEMAEDKATYQRDLAAWRQRKAEFDRNAKEERTNATKERTAQARATHGQVPTHEQVQQLSGEVDDLIKVFKPSPKMEGKTPFDQVYKMEDGSTRPVVDPKTNREIVSEIALRNRMPVDQAMSTFLKLTQFDDAPGKENFRTFVNKGTDSAGNVIIVPLEPKFDGTGKQVGWKPGKKELHLRPTQHELLNEVIMSRREAHLAGQSSKGNEKSAYPGISKMWNSITGGGASAPPPQ